MPFHHILYGRKYGHIFAAEAQNQFIMTANPNIIPLIPAAPPGAGGWVVGSTVTLSYVLGGWPSLTNSVTVNWVQNGPGIVSRQGQQGQGSFQMTQQLNPQYIQFSFTFPTNYQHGPFQTSIGLQETWSNSVASIIIQGELLGGSTGINDYIIFQSGADQFSATQGDTSVNCGQPFCPVQYSAQFIDFEGNNTQMVDWNWRLELQTQQTTYQTVLTQTQLGGVPFSDFNIFSPLNLPNSANWERNQNGDVPGKVTVSGYDNEGFFHTKSMEILVSDVPNRLVIGGTAKPRPWRPVTS